MVIEDDEEFEGEEFMEEHTQEDDFLGGESVDEDYFGEDFDDDE